MKLDRLMGILTTLLQNDRVTAPQLAEKFEVSRRTISRDIDALCQAGIPVVTAQGGNGGISIAEGYKLDKSVLTTDELSSIIVSLKGLGSVTGESQIERTLEKLAVGRDGAVVSLRENIIIDLASNYKGSLNQKIHALRAAIGARQIITFDYFYDKGDVCRRIEPYVILFQWSAWYLFGYCLDRQDFRMFKLTRLWNIEQTGDTYTPRSISAEQIDSTRYFTDHLELVADFEPSEKYLLIDTYGMNWFKPTADGKLRLTVGYTNHDYMLRWLLGFGDKVRVISPRSMADDIRRVGKNISRLYE